MRLKILVFLLVFSLVQVSRSDDTERSQPKTRQGAEKICADMKAAWDKVDSYRCTYLARISHEGKIKETVMRYSYEKPGKIRMDIAKPRKGAVLLYNPEDSEKVRVRPFPRLPFFVLKYPLSHKRVSSDSGGTVDRSDLGNRMDELCEKMTRSEILQKNAPGNLSRFEEGQEKDIYLSYEDGGRQIKSRYVLDERSFLKKIETYDDEENLLETFEWNDLELNPDPEPDLFTKF